MDPPLRSLSGRGKRSGRCGAAVLPAGLRAAQRAGGLLAALGRRDAIRIRLHKEIRQGANVLACASAMNLKYYVNLDIFVHIEGCSVNRHILLC